MKVSVVMITYNHEKFIAQAIDSILMQEVKFDYEILIGEDCSTDSTRDIVIDFQKRYSDKIRLLLPEKNLGVLKNLTTTLEACRGEYIALLEGDDYWIDPYKLQTQVDILESNAEVAIVGHRVQYWQEHSIDTVPAISPYEKPLGTLFDILRRNYIPTCSALIRKSALPNLVWFQDVVHGCKQADWPLWSFTAEKGDIVFLDKVMAVYRIHQGGVWSPLSMEEQLRWMYKARKQVIVHLTNISSVKRAEVWCHIYGEWGQMLYSANKYLLAVKYFVLALISAPWKALSILNLASSTFQWRNTLRLKRVADKISALRNRVGKSLIRRSWGRLLISRVNVQNGNAKD
ncbi:glycosyltransferase [Calothrix sp. NIES-2098]|uniref:glycosyltransferase n=1 Tax=Calothrix sp. NIES-2098 TaxID=1954171 RepID=UPI000B615FD5|nr:family 2 glycosyl transferase [Calothrix sp. NIES-2098]